MADHSNARMIIELAEVAAQITSICYVCHIAASHARDDIEVLQKELHLFQASLAKVADSLPSSPDVTGPLITCKTDLIVLLGRFDRTRGGAESVTKWGLRAWSWPFAFDKDIDIHLMAIAKHRAKFQLILQAGSMRPSVELLTDSAAIRAALSRVDNQLVDSSVHAHIYTWLAPPNVEAYLDSALRTRVASTAGLWFVETNEFKRWYETKYSRIWLDGPVGCGKTVLCSTVIAWLATKLQLTKDANVAYFFFDSANWGEMSATAFLRSLIWQLASTSKIVKETLEACQSRVLAERRRVSFVPALLEVLRAMINVAGHVYLIVDAIDQCSDQALIFHIIRTIMGWQSERIHILITSRSDAYPMDNVNDISDCHFCINESNSAMDITIYIDHILASHDRLSKWPAETKHAIKRRLLDGAPKNFLIIRFKLDMLSKCLTSNSIISTMDNFPQTLGGMYEHILCSILPSDAVHARTMLLWVCCVARLLSVVELADATGFSTDSSNFDEGDCLQASDIVRNSSRLIMVEHSKTRDDNGKSQSSLVVRLTHGSLKDYLLSSNISKGKASFFALETEFFDPNIEIAHMCTAYIEFTYKSSKDLLPVEKGYWHWPHEREIIEEHRPLYSYVTQYWWQHARSRNINKSQTSSRGDFSTFVQSDAFIFSLKFFDPYAKLGRGYRFPTKELHMLYYGVLLNLAETVQSLISQWSNHEHFGWVVSISLHAAVLAGNGNIFKMLQAAGAKVVVERPWREPGSMLQFAAAKNDLDMVNLLMRSGVCIGGEPFHVLGVLRVLGDPLIGAIFHNNSLMIQSLLESDNTPLGNLTGKSIALQMAALIGQKSIVQLLLEKDFPVDGTEGTGTPIATALINSQQGSRNSYEIVKHLLDCGANPNASSKSMETTAWDTAFLRGDSTTTEALAISLLTSEADRASDLGAWVYYRHKEDFHSMNWSHEPHRTHNLITIVDIAEYSDAGEYARLDQLSHFQVKSLSDEYKATLRIEASRSSTLGDKRLYDRTTFYALDFIQDRCRDVPIYAACRTGDVEIVRLLLRAGASVERCDRELLVALAVPHAEIIHELIKHGLNLSHSGGTALAIAVRLGKIDLVNMLLANGALVNASPNQEILHRSRKSLGLINGIWVLDYAVNDSHCVGDAPALIQACQKGNLALVERLLKHGATTQVNSKQWGSPLHAVALSVSDKCTAAIANLVVEHGADVNAVHGILGTPLHVAVKAGKANLVELLLRRGASAETVGPQPVGEFFTESSFSSRRAPPRDGTCRTKLWFHEVDKDEAYFGSRFVHEAFTFQVDDMGLTPLQIALRTDLMAMTCLLIDQGAQITALNASCPNTLGYLLEQGWDEGPRLFEEFVSYAKDWSNVVEHIACLMSKGEKADQPCGGRYHSPLQAAVGFRDVNVLKFLLDHGADVHDSGGKYGSAIQAAIHLKWEEGLDFFIAAGANLNQRTTNTTSVLTSIVLSLWKKGLVKAVENGARDESCDGELGLAFQAALSRADVEMIRILLDAGTSVNPVNEDAASAVQLLLTSKVYSVVGAKACALQLLLAKGASVMNYDRSIGSPILVAAALDDRMVLLSLLLQFGAQITHEEGEQCCAVCLLMQKEKDTSHEAMELLIENGANIGHCTIMPSYASVFRALNDYHWATAIWMIETGSDISVDLPPHGSLIRLVLASQQRSDSATLAMVKYLHEHGAPMVSPKTTKLILITRAGQMLKPLCVRFFFEYFDRSYTKEQLLSTREKVAELPATKSHRSERDGVAKLFDELIADLQ